MSGLAWFILFMLVGIISVAFITDRNRKKWRVRPEGKIPRSSWASRSAASMYVIASIEDRVAISPEERTDLEQLDVEGILAFAIAKDWISTADESSLKDQLLSTRSESSLDWNNADAEESSLNYYGGSEGYDGGGGFDGGGGGE
ncbi:hypothetical protein [Alkalihalobacillus sp. R86527]|uniref:hypothetical protein n=1 Tax=Alkalihalobacillus sp. R86527 TaxID=3093863 RepID=UPI00366DEE87